ncbi:MAG: hypothetical protein HY812_06110 [Planctomycetes bacterium]|nr:hypothetical protein [Planctomycetota bacterium]
MQIQKTLGRTTRGLAALSAALALVGSAQAAISVAKEGVCQENVNVPAGRAGSRSGRSGR